MEYKVFSSFYGRFLLGLTLSLPFPYRLLKQDTGMQGQAAPWSVLSSSWRSSTLEESGSKEALSVSVRCTAASWNPLPPVAIRAKFRQSSPPPSLLGKLLLIHQHIALLLGSFEGGLVLVPFLGFDSDYTASASFGGWEGQWLSWAEITASSMGTPIPATKPVEFSTPRGRVWELISHSVGTGLVIRGAFFVHCAASQGNL